MATNLILVSTPVCLSLCFTTACQMESCGGSDDWPTPLGVHDGIAQSQSRDQGLDSVPSPPHRNIKHCFSLRVRAAFIIALKALVVVAAAAVAVAAAVAAAAGRAAGTGGG